MPNVPDQWHLNSLLNNSRSLLREAATGKESFFSKRELPGLWRAAMRCAALLGCAVALAYGHGATASNAAATRNPGGIRLASRFSGADLGAQIDAASGSLGLGHGEIDVTKSGVVRTPIKLLPGQTLRLCAPTTWHAGLTLSSGDDIIGSFGSSPVTVSFSKPGAVITGSEVSDINVHGIQASAPAGSTGYVLLSVTAGNNVAISNCNIREMGLFASSSSAGSYKTVTGANSSHNIHVVDNTTESQAISHASGAAISLTYTWQAVVSGNITKGFDAGVQWWGGDANYAKDGAAGNKRKAGEITISGNMMTASGGAGAWGSMGDGITVSGNVMRGCGDVCLDAEGSNHVVFSNNVIEDGRNGEIGTFFYNRDVTISGNSVVSSSSQFPLLRIYNSSQSSEFNLDVLITHNHFDCGSGICVVSTAEGPAQREVFTGNVLRDARLEFTGNNQHYVEVSHNDFVFDRSSASAFNAVDIEGVNALGEELGTVKISDDTINSQVVQPRGSAAIFLRESDPNVGGIAWIERNGTIGAHPFPVDIEVEQCGGNTSVEPHFLIADNILGSGAVRNGGPPPCRAGAVAMERNRRPDNQLVDKPIDLDSN